MVGDDIRKLLDGVPDPEIPVLSINDLGIVRDVEIDGDAVTVSLAPTYSACPATEVIEASVVEHLHANGIADVHIRRVLSPPWTTDWISASGRDKLAEYGIAPPAGSSAKLSLRSPDLRIACPRCNSQDTIRISEFGSTPCKAAYKCAECLEPFEYFKCI
jgi:ring-1,2-phenylacetyl-CoA epoxidase subunit PaaD